jgi:hypothetical protein
MPAKDNKETGITKTKESDELIDVFGSRVDLEQLAKRIQVMCPGGDKLTLPEALALAQVSTVTRLNPFIGEVWYISGRGPMVGIRGARRYGNEQIAKADSSGYWTAEFFPCDIVEAGVPEDELNNVYVAFRCEIYDSISTTNYNNNLIGLIRELREAKADDPTGMALSILGKKPKWVGYGFSTKSEKTKMNKTQAARKRAESDALKKKFYIPFGANVSEYETVDEQKIIEGVVKQ